MGRQLWRRALDHVCDLGLTVIVVWVLQENAKARRFYERQGAKPMEVRDFRVATGLVREIGYRVSVPPDMYQVSWLRAGREAPMGDAEGALQVTRAQPDQADTVLSILQEAQQWLHDRGINQGVVPPRERLYGRIARGEVYIAQVNGRPAATISLSTTGEPFWEDSSQEGAYVHSLAVAREFGGRGLGRELLRWAEGAALLMGKRYLRLDIWGDNMRLSGYYRSVGFVHVRDDRSEGWLASLFQKDLRGVDSHPQHR